MTSIGIQGDVGSATEYAAIKFCKKMNIINHEFVYLITAENTLEKLTDTVITYAVLAIESPLGHPIPETVEAAKKYPFKKVDEINIEVPHVLLARKILTPEEYNRIISHPQALNKHKSFLSSKYQNCKFMKVEDTGMAARKLSEGKYDEKSLIIAMKSAAELYNLQIIESCLPASKGYLTKFYLVVALKH